MKKYVILIVLLIIVLAIVGGVYYMTRENSNNQNEPVENTQNVIQNTENTENTENTIQNAENLESTETLSSTRIKLSFGSEEVFVTLDDNESSREFLEMLPLTLNAEDYNNTEKIATLPEELTTQGAPSGFEPQVGDFAYYAPWGNLSIFYKNFRYSNSLVKLGVIESGIEKIESMSGDFTLVIEKVN